MLDALKIQDLKMQDMNLADQTAGHENTVQKAMYTHSESCSV